MSDFKLVNLERIKKGHPVYSDPFSIFMFYDLTAEEKFMLNKSYANQHLNGLPRNIFSFNRERKSKIVVGYFGGDFNDFPLTHLTTSMYKFHDRNQFIVIGFANRPSDGSKWRAALERSFDHFVDVSQILDMVQLAQLIRHYNVDILFNMNGWTSGGRHDIFALRCAPI